MNDTARRTIIGLLMLAACAPSGVQAQFREEPDPTETSLSGMTPETVILTWPTYSYRLAREMISKYGQPTEFRDNSLIWLDNGPWKRTVVYRGASGGGVRRQRDRLEQTAEYRVPEDKLDELARFDKQLEADKEKARLTVRSDSESDNFLALNLAHDVINGKRSPQEASKVRTRLSRLAGAGKSSSYLTGLLFTRGDQYKNPKSTD